MNNLNKALPKDGILAIIPARGGSRGIKRKNIIDFNGKPLLAWSIEAAKESGVFDEVMVSTEDEEIASIAKKYGASVPFLRSSEAAQEHSLNIEFVMDVLSKYSALGTSFSTIIILQPTSPLRNSDDIRQAFEFFLKNARQSLASVVEVKHPILARAMGKDDILVPIVDNPKKLVRRQDLEEAFVVNGAIYINEVKELHSQFNFNENKIGFVMEFAKSLDIDTPDDLELAKIVHEAMLCKKIS